MDLNYTSPEEQYADPAYDAYLAELERMCPAQFFTGGSDPYATGCDLERGHYPTTPHSGDDPFGNDGRVEWRGGGSVAGDALPYRDVVFINADGTRQGREASRRPRVRPARFGSWNVSSHDTYGDALPPDLTGGHKNLEGDYRCPHEWYESRTDTFWFCTRIPDHTGRHAAGNGAWVLAVWPSSLSTRNR